jgi:hypothetical protein
VISSKEQKMAEMPFLSLFATGTWECMLWYAWEDRHRRHVHNWRYQRSDIQFSIHTYTV